MNFLENIGDFVGTLLGSDDDNSDNDDNRERTLEREQRHKARRTRRARTRENFSSGTSQRMTRHSSESDSEYSDDGSMYTMDHNQNSGDTGNGNNIDYNDPLYFLNKQNDISNNRKFEKMAIGANKSTVKRGKKSNFLAQFDDMEFDNSGDPASFNAVGMNNGTNGNVKRLELERSLANDGGYSFFNDKEDGMYGVIPKEHIKMNTVPNLRLKRASDPSRLATASQRKMELFTGDENRVDWNHKEEVGPLFDPIMGATNIYGNSSMTDEIQARMIPGKERRNEVPFEPVRQTPGLGLGYNQNSHHGLHNTFRVLPKSIDELRGPRGPQVTYSMPVKAGKKGEKGPIMGKTSKRRPDRFKEMGTERMVGGFGYIRAPTMHAQVNPEHLATGNRGSTDQQRYGAAYNANSRSTPDELRSKHKNPSKQNYRYDGPRNVVMYESLQGNPARSNSDTYVPRQTQREQPNNYRGPAGTAERGGTYVFNPANNTPDPNMRNVHAQRDRLGVAVTRQGGHYLNNRDAPDPTMRNVHAKRDRLGVAVTGQGGHYLNNRDAPDPTLRNIHNKPDRMGRAVTGQGGHYVNNRDAPDPTLRNIHNKPDRMGRAVTGQGGHYVNNRDAPDPTLRNIHNKPDRMGRAVTGHGGHYVNNRDVPDATLRNIHSKYDRMGKGVTGKGGHYVNNRDVPDATLRNIHAKTDRMGVAVTGRGGHYVNNRDAPDPTMRNIHAKTDRMGVAVTGQGGHYVNNRDVPGPTMRNIHAKTDRMGVAVTGRGGHYVNNRDVPDPTNRDMYKSSRSKGGAGHDVSGPIVFNYKDAIPDPTNRDMYKSKRSKGGAGSKISALPIYEKENNTPAPTNRDMYKSKRSKGGAGSVVGAQRSRRDANTTLLNDAKEIASMTKNRAFTMANYEKGPTLQFTRVELADPLNSSRVPNGRATETNSRFIPSINFNRNETFYEDNRRNTIPDTLRHNVFINNVPHRAVPVDPNDPYHPRNLRHDNLLEGNGMPMGQLRNFDNDGPIC